MKFFYTYISKTEFDSSIVIEKHIQTNKRGNLLFLNQRTITQSMPGELRGNIYESNNQRSIYKQNSFYSVVFGIHFACTPRVFQKSFRNIHGIEKKLLG